MTDTHRTSKTLVQRLQERAEWLRSEYRNGGNFEHLSAREQECTYIAHDVVKPEIERLRAALERIASADPSPGQLEKWCNWVHCKARDALNGVPSETSAVRACQHDLLKPDTTIEIIDKWKAKCKVCMEFFDLPGRPEKASEPLSGDQS